MRTQQTAKHRSDQRPGVSACQVLKTRTEPHTSWGPHLLTWNHLLGLKRNVWTYPTQRVYRNRIQVNKCEHSSLPDTSPTVGLDYLHGVCAQLVLKNRNSLTRPGGLIY